jgi:hypothetical protein
MGALLKQAVHSWRARRGQSRLCLRRMPAAPTSSCFCNWQHVHRELIEAFQTLGRRMVDGAADTLIHL